MGLANASLLGAGYLMLRRWGLAVGSVSVTVTLVAALATVAPFTWLQVVALLWWLAVAAHGWRLAGGRLRRSAPDPVPEPDPGPEPDPEPDPVPEPDPGPARPGRAWRQRLIALGVTAPVLLAFAGLRADASQIRQDAAEAHRAGECTRAISVLEGLGAGHQVVDAALVDRADDSIEACELLIRAERQAGDDRLLAARTLESYEAHPQALWEGARERRADLVLAQAADELDTALTGDTDALAAGFRHLSTVLEEFTGQDEQAEEVMNGFLGDLPTEDACQTTAIANWLGSRPAWDNLLDRSADVVPRIAPAAIVGCGDDHMAVDDWDQARSWYQQLLDRFPEHDLAAEAEEGIEQADTAIELAHLRELLELPHASGQPAYCDGPAPYRGAAPYEGNGPHPALLFGADGHKSALPSSWLAEDAADAVLVICAGVEEMGDAVETCQYESDLSPFGYTDVTFRKKKIPVRVYEVRTGELVSDTGLQIGGASCPEILHYETFIGDRFNHPPSEVHVESSDADVRAAYERLIKP